MKKEKCLHIFNSFNKDKSAIPGELNYNSEFCSLLLKTFLAEAASIWQLDLDGNLHLKYATNIDSSIIPTIFLENGLGVSGAAVLTRKAVSVTDTSTYRVHYKKVDGRIENFVTTSMISAPIMLNDEIYGVVNILNYRKDGGFPKTFETELTELGKLYAKELKENDRLNLITTPDLLEKINIGSLALTL